MSMNISELSEPLTATINVYTPVKHHWFYSYEIDNKILWKPFSRNDSEALDQRFEGGNVEDSDLLQTDGGRFDVDLCTRERRAVYWNSNPSIVRKCSWFFKNNSEGYYFPFDEDVATQLENEYKVAMETNQWHKRIDLNEASNRVAIFHSADVLVLTSQNQYPTLGTSQDEADTESNSQATTVIRRGVQDFKIRQGEPAQIDHLLFLVHGIGSVCDLKFRTVEEVVDDFRETCLQLVQSHYKSAYRQGAVNRIEVLPISWHHELHSEETGIDKKLQNITLDSIPKLRHFTNDTLLDILFYTSPIYSQIIVTTVANQLNQLYKTFCSRNTHFSGQVYLGGHSLGSLILFDLLSRQKVSQGLHLNLTNVQEDEINQPNKNVQDTDDNEDMIKQNSDRLKNRRISYMLGEIGTVGQVQIIYPQLEFYPSAFFALGSPIGMFVTIRGLHNLGENFSLPTCPAFFNIFHPYDPVAYRIESLIKPEMANLKPVLIPHHKGRKRMHLELKETMLKVGADLKQKFMDSVKSTWNSVYQLAMFQQQQAKNKRYLEESTMEDALADIIEKTQDETESTEEDIDDEVGSNSASKEERATNAYGALNKGRRIDYVLQEAPLEFFNEYLFALTSHVCYWESRDTILLIIKEIYGSASITPDDQIPQQSMTIERHTTNATT